MLELLGLLALILVTMVSFAAGVALAARRREYPVAVIDLLAVSGLWLVVFWLRPQLSRLPLLAATMGLGLCAGAVLAAIRVAGGGESSALPPSELPAHAQETAATAVPVHRLRRAWQRWQAFAGRMGNVQARLLMGFFYFVIVTPFGLGLRLLSDPLAIKKAPAQSNWQPKEGIDATLEAAREQG